MCIRDRSGYTTETDGGTTTYIYTLHYRVRLQNEQDGFIERNVYETNGKTTLKYRVIETVSYTHLDVYKRQQNIQSRAGVYLQGRDEN